MVLGWGFKCFSDIEGNSTNKCIYAFSFLVGKYRESQSINAKLFLPIIPIGIVAYAFTLLSDNLCRNSCIHLRVTLSRSFYFHVFSKPTNDPMESVAYNSSWTRKHAKLLTVWAWEFIMRHRNCPRITTNKLRFYYLVPSICLAGIENAALIGRIWKYWNLLFQFCHLIGWPRFQWTLCNSIQKQTNGSEMRNWILAHERHMGNSVGYFRDNCFTSNYRKSSN